MDDLINRQAAIDALDKRFGSIPMEKTEILLLRKDLRNLPSAQPVRKSGQWIKRKKGAIGYNCSCCGKSDISNHFDYCPNCGADMRGGEDG